MSLDVYLTQSRDCHCDECGHKHTNPKACVFEKNITHNLNRMAEAAGIYNALWNPEKIGITKASQLIPILEEGLAKLKSDPEEYKEYNPDNGWGKYENLVDFTEDYLKACKELPDADISVSK